MKRRLIVLAGILLVAALAAHAQTQTGSLTAEGILDRVNAVWQGDSFHGILGLDVVLGGQTKSHKLEVWTLGKELALVRVLEPAADANSGYLQLGEDLWYYAPGVGAIKLPSIAIGDALFGAGPSLEDLSHGTLSNDYQVSAQATATGFFLTLIPHEDAPVVFGKLDIWVTEDYLMEKMIYYDQRSEVLQTATFTAVVESGGRRFPSTVSIEDVYGDRTIEHIELAQFDIELDPQFFSLDTFNTWGDTQ
jgi:hypothetical protein